MKKLLLGIVTMSVGVLGAFNPAHWAQFLQTKVCHNCDLRDADFNILFGSDQHPDANPELYYADLNGSDLRGARMWFVHLNEADLRGANLLGWFFSSAPDSSRFLIGARCDQNTQYTCADTGYLGCVDSRFGGMTFERYNRDGTSAC
jgi:hypothetical protein